MYCQYIPHFLIQAYHCRLDGVAWTEGNQSWPESVS